MSFKEPVATETQKPREVKEVTPSSGGIVDNVEVPYTDYETQNGKPFIVDHYGLSDRWKDYEGGFGEEIATIDGYIQGKITNGDLANSQSAIKEELKKIEKLTNMSKEERVVIKLGNISAYAKFLMEADNIKFNARKYR